MPLPDPSTAPPWRDSLREPSDMEVAKWLLATSPENRRCWFDQLRENRHQATHCWFSDHDTRLDELLRDLHQARQRIAWLETHYRPMEEQP
jgi:hypothetical protein